MIKVNAIIQARCGSTRFPNKVFADINGKPLIWHSVNRLYASKRIDRVIVATTVNSKDDMIEQWCEANDVRCYRGSENDVLNRYYEASKAYPSEVVVRITADDPFKEPSVIDLVISKLLTGDYDLVTDNYPPSFPEGFDCEAFTFKALEEAELSTKDAYEREHVTQFFYHNPDKYRIGNVKNETDLSYLRWTIDKDEDLEMVRSIYAHRNPDSKGMMYMEEILEILKEHPEIIKINSEVERSAMYKQ